MTRAELLLVQVMEEASEVAKEAAKCLRFHPHALHPKFGVTNAERVIVELIDLLTVITMLQEELVLPILTVEKEDELGAIKRKKVEEHLLYSSSCGVLE